MKTMKALLVLLASAGFATPVFGESDSHCISAALANGQVEIRNNCHRDVHVLYCVVNPDASSKAYDCAGGGGSGQLAAGKTAALDVASTDPTKIELRWFACATGIAEKWDNTGNLGVCRNPGESEAEPVSLATRDDRRALQTALKTEGFNPGPADGIFGSGTRAAVKEWQESIGQAATGELTDEQVRLLLPRRQLAQAAVVEPAAGGVWASNATAPSASEDLWGSIVFSKNSGGGYTWAFVWNAGGHEPARQEAVDLCQQEGGSNCAEIGWFRNACGALAVDPTGVGGYGTGWGSDTGEAEAMALLECESAGNTNCQLKASRCSNAGLEFAGIGEPGEVLAPTAGETDAAEAAAIAALTPKCPDRSEDFLCWYELDDQPGCYIYWHGSPSQYGDDGDVLSAGECRGGKFTGSITGTGPIHGYENSSFTLEIPIVDGKINGRYVVVENFGDGGSIRKREATYVDSKQHGPFYQSSESPGGYTETTEGSMIDGRHPHGLLVRKSMRPDGHNLCTWEIWEHGEIVEEGGEWATEGRWRERPDIC